jgi:hypothetical protein
MGNLKTLTYNNKEVYLYSYFFIVMIMIQSVKVNYMNLINIKSNLDK